MRSAEIEAGSGAAAEGSKEADMPADTPELAALQSLLNAQEAFEYIVALVHQVCPAAPSGGHTRRGAPQRQPSAQSAATPVSGLDLAGPDGSPMQLLHADTADMPAGELLQAGAVYTLVTSQRVEGVGTPPPGVPEPLDPPGASPRGKAGGKKGAKDKGSGKSRPPSAASKGAAEGPPPPSWLPLLYSTPWSEGDADAEAADAAPASTKSSKKSSGKKKK